MNAYIMWKIDNSPVHCFSLYQFHEMQLTMSKLGKGNCKLCQIKAYASSVLPSGMWQVSRFHLGH